MGINNTKSNLILNISPITFCSDEVEVGFFDYRDEQHFNSLRAELAHSHVVKRDRRQIQVVPVTRDAEVIGARKRTLKLSSNPYLVTTLVRNALIGWLSETGRPSPKYIPLKITGGKNKIIEALPTLNCPSWLAVKSRFVLDIRVLNFGGDRSFVGLVGDIETARIIDRTCADLLREDFNFDKLYVGEMNQQDDSRLARRFALLGCVSHIQNGEIFLSDSRAGISSIEAAKAVLEPSHTSFDRCLQHVFNEDAPKISSAVEKRLAEERCGPNKLKKLQEIIKFLADKKIEIIPGVPIQFATFLDQKNVKTFPQIKKARPTIYVFDPAGSRTHTWHDGGLNEHGPYTRNYFTPSRPRVCVICQKKQKGQVEQFLYKFQEGIKPANGAKGYFAAGLVRKYALEGITFDFYLTDDASPEAYYRATRLALQHSSASRWDLALVQTEDNFHQFHGGENPYLVAKAAFLMHQIPTQAFESETMAMPDSQLGFALNNMALATYAKMDGIPWLVKGNPVHTQEFVVGLGSAYVGRGRLGERERVVGITTVFKGDGNYFLSNLSQAVSIEDYQSALLSSLQMTIDRLRTEMNWQPRSKVRLIFHSFKPMNFSEVDAVRALVNGLGDYVVDYAFLHIKDNHPYFLFDESQPGVKDFRTKQLKGVMAPNRGLYFPLSDREVLLTLTGANELKKPEDGLPHPVLLELHSTSNFEDMNYLAQQVYTFSCHSWRSFFPSPMPVTILYSDLVASLLGKLASVPRWNPDAMLGHIGTTRWFL